MSSFERTDGGTSGVDTPDSKLLTRYFGEEILKVVGAKDHPETETGKGNVLIPYAILVYLETIKMMVAFVENALKNKHTLELQIAKEILEKVRYGEWDGFRRIDGTIVLRQRAFKSENGEIVYVIGDLGNSSVLITEEQLAELEDADKELALCVNANWDEIDDLV